MTKSLRLLVLAGTLALMASPVFADGSGGTNTGAPDPPPASGSATTTTSGSSTTTTVIQTILTYLGL